MEIRDAPGHLPRGRHCVIYTEKSPRICAAAADWPCGGDRVTLGACGVALNAPRLLAILTLAVHGRARAGVEAQPVSQSV